MFHFLSLVLSPRRALAGGSFLVLAALLPAQVNTASSNFQLELTFLGSFYETGAPENDDISDLLELSIGAFTVNGINGIDALGTYSSSFSLNGDPVDFEESDLPFASGDTFSLTLDASAMAGPGVADFSLLSVATNLYGYFYGDSETPVANLVFDYSWSWTITLQEHASPDGNTSAAAISGYTSNEGFIAEAENFMEIEGLDPLEDGTFRFGIGGPDADGTPKELFFANTGQLYLQFLTEEGYVDMDFLSEVQAYAEMDAGGVIPEPAFAGLLLLLGAAWVPFLRRVRR